MIDLDALIGTSKYFRWKEALWLPTWKIFCYPTPEIHKNIIYTAVNVADPIRDIFKKPMQIHSWYRPELYNDWDPPHGVRGAQQSQHKFGKAIDFSIYTISIDEIHSVLEPRLEKLNIRMERPDGKNRVHIDWKKVLPGEDRYVHAR